MALTVTPSQRRTATLVLLALAVLGLVIRAASDPASAWHDVGTLLLILWLPVVGNLIAHLMGLFRTRNPPPPGGFAPDAPFAPQLQARLEVMALPAGFAASLDATEARAALIVGQHGFTVRLGQPVAQWLAAVPVGTSQDVALELLRPEAAAGLLGAGTDIHLVMGRTAVARGYVL